MAALNPARLIGIDAECGSQLKKGSADLVALDAQGRVCLMLVGGRVAFAARDG